MNPAANVSPAPKAVIPANATDANASFFMPPNPHSTRVPAITDGFAPATNHPTVPDRYQATLVPEAYCIDNQRYSAQVWPRSRKICKES
jgi:hypothetical protein